MTNQNPGFPFAVVDVETTGFSHRDRVLEIAVVHADADGTVTGRWSTLLNPERHIPNTRVHGISAGDVTEAPRFAEIAAVLAEQLAGRVFVAHNAPFDARLLTAEFARLGLTGSPFRGASLCTLALTGRLLPASGRGLAAALTAAGITNAHAHAALGDAEATAELLRHYLRRSPDTVGDLLGPVHPVLFPVKDVDVLYGSAPQDPVPLRTRAQSGSAAAAVRDGVWLNQLATGVPVVGEPNVDEYLDLLASAMLDRELSVHEINGLTTCAEELGIGRDEARVLHAGFVRQLAVLAWADGTVTDDEREELHSVASALGVDAGEVDRLLDSPVHASTAGVDRELHLSPGDRVTFTGETELPRAVWEARATDAGLDVGGVKASSVLVVAADPDSLSAKAEKGRSLGVPVVTEAGFARLLGELENSGSGEIDPQQILAVSRRAGSGDADAADDDMAEDIDGSIADPAETAVHFEVYEDDDDAPVTDLGDDGTGLVPDPQTLGDALDTALGLLGFLSRTHGSLRSAVEFQGVSAVDGELPAHVEDLLSRAGDPSGAFRLAVSARRGAVADVLGAVWAQCDDREHVILRERIVAQDKATLEQIARGIGVTRERIRQIQVKLTARLTKVASAGPVADLLAGIRSHAHPVNTLEAVTTVFPELAVTVAGWNAPLWQILDAVDDDFRVDDGWVCFPDLPTAARRTGNLLAPVVNAEGVVGLTDILEKSSIDDPVVLQEWLVTCGYLVAEGHVFTRVGSQPARAAGLLSVVGHPMSASEMYARISDAKTERSFRNGLGRGENLVRVGVDMWALSRWGLEEYTGIADLIGRRVDAAADDGEEGVALDTLVDDLTRDFGVSASSVRTYAGTGDYICTGGVVRRRTEPMVNNAEPEESNGVYRRDGRWCLLLTVTPEHLRGSGVTVPNGLTAGLDLSWNEPLMLAGAYGDHRVNWGGTGNSTVGSIRRFLVDLDCGAGDRVWIDLHDGEGFTVTTAPAATPGLTGLSWLADHVGADPAGDDATCYSAVAEALDLSPDAPRRKVLARFRHRSDAEAVAVLENLWM